MRAISSRYELSPVWHVLAASVVAYALFAIGADVCIPEANWLERSGHAFLASFLIGMSLGVGIINWAVLLPWRNNASRVGWIRQLGKAHFLLRCLMAGSLAAGSGLVESLMMRMVG